MIAPEKVRADSPPWFRWTDPDLEWLEYQHLELGKPSRKIAAEVGCSEWKAQQWIRDAGWRKPKKVSDDPLAPKRIGQGAGARFVDVKREWLIQEYVEKDKSAKQIADEIGTTHHTVWQWLLKHKVPTRTREEMNERHSERMSGAGNPAWSGGATIGYHRRLALKHYPHYCEWCGHTKRLQVHHRDHDRENGNIENLALMCGSCNRLEGQLWALREKGRADFEVGNDKLVVTFRRY